MERYFSDRFTQGVAFSSYDPLTQSSLTVEGSSFSQLNFAFDDTDSDLRYDFAFPDYTHFLKASALLLYKLDFPVIVYNSSFSSNHFQLKRLLVAEPPKPATLKSALFSSRSGLLVESIIYSYLGQASFQLLNNSFTLNGGSHGPVGI